ncbi:MAG: type IV pili methyl-accepting chemotaxis transducer N-terminal domain-containing protein [Sedimenticola sp.]
MNITKYIMPILLILFIGLPFSASAASIDIAAAVDKAGKQRMLSQKIAKAYFYLGKRVRPDKVSQQLQDSLSLFKMNHSDLKATIADKGVQDMLAFVDFAVDEYAELAERPYSDESAALVLDLSETILEASQDIVVKIESMSKVRKSKVVNLAGRQRMLTQRIAKYYIAYQAGFRDKNSIEQLEIAVNEFESALDILKNEKVNTPQINAQLTKVSRLWRLVRNFFLGVEKGGLPVTVLATTDSIMKSMNTITGMYVTVSE